MTEVAKTALLAIDEKLDHLVKEIELLNYINPVNITEQKKLFFDSYASYIRNIASSSMIVFFLIEDKIENSPLSSVAK